MTLSFKEYCKILFAFFCLLTIFIGSPTVIYAQQTDNQLAQRYFQNQEFEKAAEIYKRLYDDTGFKSHRDNYLRCLIELRDFDTAERFLNRELRRNRNDLYLTIDLGMIYLSKGNVSEAESKFEKAVNIAGNSRNNIIAAANTFQRYRNYEWAEKTYLEGRKKTGEQFHYQLGNIYFMQRNYEKMIDAYANDLMRDPGRLNIIQTRLQHIISRDIDQSFDSVIERVLLEKIQKNPQADILTELLVWQFTQTGKFEAALNQLIAVDRRRRSNGLKVLEFGKILSDNQEYELAIRAFEYLLDRGKSDPIYNMAYIEFLNTLFIKNTKVLEPDIEEIIKLESMLHDALDIVRRRESFRIIYALAQIKAFYLEKYDEAIALLTHEIDNRRLNSSDESIAKLLLGDIYMLNGNPWDATLTYAQVEKSNSESPIGHEARFKRAKLAYYNGEFDWAQAQLVVLKGSTSKLIANDALELSVFISDNFNMDTTATTMQMFSRADFYIFTKQYNNALDLLDSIRINFPSHSLHDHVLYRKGQIFEQTNNYEKASEYYLQVATDFYYDILADKALFRYGKLQEKLRNYENAEDAYFRIISEFPASIFTVEARIRLREMFDNNLIN